MAVFIGGDKFEIIHRKTSPSSAVFGCHKRKQGIGSKNQTLA